MVSEAQNCKHKVNILWVQWKSTMRVFSVAILVPVFAQLIQTSDWDQNSGVRLVLGLSKKTERETNPKSEVAQWDEMLQPVNEDHILLEQSTSLTWPTDPYQTVGIHPQVTQCMSQVTNWLQQTNTRLTVKLAHWALQISISSLKLVSHRKTKAKFFHLLLKSVQYCIFVVTFFQNFKGCSLYIQVAQNGDFKGVAHFEAKF